MGNDILLFDEPTHTYTYNGRNLPSVTHVLEHVGISDFEMVPIEVLESAATFGKEVHKATQYHDEGRDFECDEAVLPYLDQWIQFCDTQQITFLSEGIEYKFRHKIFEYAGTIDRIAYINGKLTIIDIKTGSKTRAHPIQLAAYSEGVKDLLGKNTKIDRLCVHLSETKAVPEPHTADINDFNVFLSALNLYKWRN